MGDNPLSQCSVVSPDLFSLAVRTWPVCPPSFFRHREPLHRRPQAALRSIPCNTLKKKQPHKYGIKLAPNCTVTTT